MRVHRCSWTSGPPWSSASVTFRAPSTPPPGSHREAHPADRAATTPRHRGDLPLRSPLNARRGAVGLGGYDERNRPDRRDRRMARRRTHGAHRSRTLGSGTPGPTDRRVPGTRRDSDEHRGAACHMVLRRRRCGAGLRRREQHLRHGPAALGPAAQPARPRPPGGRHASARLRRDTAVPPRTFSRRHCTEKDRIVVVPPLYHCFGMVIGNLMANNN